jgi:hypothetical protein
MATSQFLNVGTANGLATSCSVVGIFNANDTSAVVELPIRWAGQFGMLYTYASTAPTMASATIYFYKNQASTSLSVTYSTSQSGIKENTRDTITVIDTDEINYNGATADPLFRLNLIGVRFNPTSPSNMILTLVAARSSSGVSVGVGSTIYCCANGELQGTTSEAQTKFSAGKAMTAAKLYTYVSSNSGMATMTCKTRVNGVDGAQSTTYTSGQTGAKEDTYNTDTISIGDDFNYSVSVSGFTGTITIKTLCVHLYTLNVTSATQFYPLMASSSDGIGVNFNTTTYCGCAGDLLFTTTEADTQLRPRFTIIVSSIGVYVSANTIATSASNIYFRDNGVDSTVTVSYNAGQTGLKADSNHTATITSAADKMSYKVVTPNTSGTLTITWIGLFSKAEGLARNVFVYTAVDRASTY